MFQGTVGRQQTARSQKTKTNLHIKQYLWSNFCSKNRHTHANTKKYEDPNRKKFVVCIWEHKIFVNPMLFQSKTKPTQTRRDQRVVSGGRLLALYLHRDCRKCKIKQRKKYNRIKQNGTEQNRIEHNKFWKFLKALDNSPQKIIYDHIHVSRYTCIYTYACVSVCGRSIQRKLPQADWGLK